MIMPRLADLDRPRRRRPFILPEFLPVHQPRAGTLWRCNALHERRGEGHST
jgi:hypothetical protein